jgi:apolipoprotein N-acyltransferase
MASLTDLYDRPQPWWRRHSSEVAAAAVFVLTVMLTVAMFPTRLGHSSPEAAYAFAAPAIFWAYGRPRFKLYALTLFAAQAVAWTLLLCWLRHVSWIALLLLGPFIGAWVGTWYLAVWWTMPRMVGRPVSVRLSAQFGLAGLWVLIEASRNWFLGGFPWLPLAASQWQQAALLQIAAYTGAGGISFVLIVANIGFTAFFHRLLREGETGLRRRSQECNIALLLLLACVFLMVRETSGYQQYEQPLARVAFVQPYIPQKAKWDPDDGPEIIRIMQQEAVQAGTVGADLVLWPESVTPWPVIGDPTMRALVEHMAQDARAPMLFGTDAVEKGADGQEIWHNAACVVRPDLGLQPGYYAKRKLVPFGEYVPFRPLFGWLSKIEPLGGDDTPGTDPAPLFVNLKNGAQAIGVLICYEDIFPQFARDTVVSGADFLTVVTNDAWYGEEGAAYQHAASSVLRAVEMRRPVLRCGNGGWSGWIDEYGSFRGNVLTNGKGSVYFRGVGTLNVRHDIRWVGRLSFFARHGDWFVLLCAALVVLGHALLRIGPKVSET